MCLVHIFVIRFCTILKSNINDVFDWCVFLFGRAPAGRALRSNLFAR